ncbi:MAG: Cna B-type domain-containing protein [Ruminococcus sp.]
MPKTVYVITNKYTPDKVNIPVSKSWDDSNNQDGKRVGEVEVQLYADGSAVAGKVLKLNEGNGWKGTFQDLDKYKKGQEIKYTVVGNHKCGRAAQQA